MQNVRRLFDPGPVQSPSGFSSQDLIRLLRSTEQSSYSAVLSAPPVSLPFCVGFRQFTSVTLKFWSRSKTREAPRFFLALRHIGSEIRLSQRTARWKTNWKLVE